MLKNITLGQYFPGDSFLHQLDPRVKILIVIVYIVALFFMESISPFLILGVILFLLLIYCRIPIKVLIKGLKPLRFLVIITFLINALLTDGEVLLKWQFLKITKEGLYLATVMALRLIFLVLGTSVLTLTTSPIALTDGVEKLLNPLKPIGVPAHELAMMMTIALRFVPTLLEETDRIMKAQSARGADFETGNMIAKAKAMVPLLVPLFINSFRRADELAVAMEARCYRGGEGRTKLNPIVLKKRDIRLALLMSTVLILIAAAGKLRGFTWPI